MPTVDEVTARYIQLRDEKDILAKRHKDEMEPLGRKMQAIENWLQAKMQQDGVDSYRTEHGTPYLNTATNVSLQDADAFKTFAMHPAALHICDYLNSSGITMTPDHLAAIKQILQVMPRWGIMDVRAGKKGIQEMLESTGTPPPGVIVTKFTSVNIRRAG